MRLDEQHDDGAVVVLNLDDEIGTVWRPDHGIAIEVVSDLSAAAQREFRVPPPLPDLRVDLHALSCELCPAPRAGTKYCALCARRVHLEQQRASFAARAARRRRLR